MHETYIKEVPGAEKAVLFIHGFMGSPEHFNRFAESVPDSISVYSILLKGHGGSVADFGRASMQQWKTQVSELMNELAAKYKNIYITAHSMGTFFAMEEAIKHKDTVRKIFLLQTPLKIGVKPSAFFNTFKSLFDAFGDDDVGRAYKKAHSIKLNFKVWEYISWIPRYLELFEESKRARITIAALKTPCLIFQSAKDELVSMKSLNFIPKSENITVKILENSGHFIYGKEDYDLLLREFYKMITG